MKVERLELEQERGPIYRAHHRPKGASRARLTDHGSWEAAAAELLPRRLTAEQRRFGERDATPNLSQACSWLLRESEAEAEAAREMSYVGIAEEVGGSGYWSRARGRRADALAEWYGLTPAELSEQVRARLRWSYRAHNLLGELEHVLPPREEEG